MEEVVSCRVLAKESRMGRIENTVFIVYTVITGFCESVW